MPNFKSLSIDEQAYIYKHRPMINDLMSAIEQRLTRELGHGQKVPGYKLVEGRTLRKWRSAEDAEEALRKHAATSSLRVRDFMDTKLASPARVEKKLGKKHQLILDNVLKPQGQPTLVVATDKRNELDLLKFGEYTNE